jgi:hypothetical protein
MANTKKRRQAISRGDRRDEDYAILKPMPNIPGFKSGTGPGGAAASGMRNAKDPVIQFTRKTSEGTVSGTERASTLGLSETDRAELSPLNSPARRKARQKASAGVFGANRPGGAR